MSLDIERIRKAGRRVRRFLKENSRRPSSESVHDLRTSARSLETAMTALGLDSHKPVARFLRDLGKVRKRAGNIRDMDVLTAKTLMVKPDRELDCLVQLLEHLGAERNHEALKLRRGIEKLGPQIRKDIKQTYARVEKALKQSVPLAFARTLQMAKDLERPARLSRRNLHPYRLKVKEMRNVLLLSDDADQEFVQELGNVKDAIGEWHDWEELVGIATDTLDHGPSCALIKELKAIGDEKYESALALTTQLRTNYLTRSTRVLRAVSTIA